MPSLWSPLTGYGPWLRPSGTRATTGALRTCACPRPDPSARPTWLRSGRMGTACSRPWKGRMRRQTRPRCPQSLCCAECGRGTIMAHEQYGIDLVGPARPDQSWQSRAEAAFSAADFAVDWDRRVARCPEGQESTGWFESAQRPGQRSSIRARFRAADCRACASRTRCTRARLGRHGRVLALLAKRECEALAAARAREGTAEGRRLYAQRQGVESTLSQGVRAFGLRRTRYRGLAKTRLQHVATAAALTLDRVAAWFAGRPLAPTRISRFAALAA